MDIIVLFGAPGSGKGSQAKNISKNLKFPILSTGTLARDQVNSQTELGNVIEPYISQGKLIPDEIVIDLFYKSFSNFDTSDGIILDGFPRTLNQSLALDSLLDKYFKGTNKLSIFYLNVPLSEIVKRICGREICGSCAAVFNVDTLPPIQSGICDDCGTALVVRQDDTVEIITKRFAEYEELTQPLTDYYSNRISILDGLSDQDDITSNILSNIYNDKT